MKKLLLYFGAMSIMALGFSSCQTELYDDPYEKPTGLSSEQGVYIAGSNEVSQFLESGSSLISNEIKIRRVRVESTETTVNVRVGTAADVAAYNEAHKTSYVLMPSTMFSVPKTVTFAPGYTEVAIPLELKNIQFSPEGSYVVPLFIESNGSVDIIDGENSVLFIAEEMVKTKVLHFAGSGSEKDGMFPNDFKVDQWTMEMMIRRSRYADRNQAIGGTKLVSGSSMNDEIYTRFGDVTIDNNQLQMKTANSQIDVDKAAFAAQPNEWYMLTFVYDGTKNSIYVNGVLVASREMRTGPYGLTGFWLSGNNHFIREVRFWKTARTAKQISDNVWKMVNPDDENLLLYYPGNGKKRDSATGEVTEDESMIWDWSKSGQHLPMPRGAVFQDNNGEPFVFPLQK